MESIDQILKQDAAGRVWTPRAQREAVLDEFERSGLPATKFAAQIGVKYQTFVSWVQKRRKERTAANAPAVQSGVRARLDWVEATVAHPVDGALMVHLPGGARLEIRDPAQVMLAARLLRVLVSEGGWAC